MNWLTPGRAKLGQWLENLHHPDSWRDNSSQWALTVAPVLHRFTSRPLLHLVAQAQGLVQLLYVHFLCLLGFLMLFFLGLQLSLQITSRGAKNSALFLSPPGAARALDIRGCSPDLPPVTKTALHSHLSLQSPDSLFFRLLQQGTQALKLQSHSTHFCQAILDAWGF